MNKFDYYNERTISPVTVNLYIPILNKKESMTERKYLRWKKCLICNDFVKLMFPEDARNMLIIYEPAEGMSNESKNCKKKQLGYIHRACLEKANSMLRTKYNEPGNSSISEVV